MSNYVALSLQTKTLMEQYMRKGPRQQKHSSKKTRSRQRRHRQEDYEDYYYEDQYYYENDYRQTEKVLYTINAEVHIKLTTDLHML